MCHSHGEELKQKWCRAKRREMQQCYNILVLAESMAERQKENKEEKEGAVQPLYNMHAKHVITIPKDIQLTRNTHGETHDEL